MKKSFIFLTLACLLFFGMTTRAHAHTPFVAFLSGAQEVPPNDSPAAGHATLALNDAHTRLEMTIQLAGLDLDGNQTADPSDNVLGMHIHRAPAGVNGPVVFGLISPNNDLNNDLVIDPVAGTIFTAWDLAEGNGTTLADQLGNLVDGGLYFNVHTPAFPGGEIRGQILLDSDGDGLPDQADECPHSDLAETVIIAGCDSGVANLLFDNGCTLADAIQGLADAAENHGQFSSAVAELTNELKAGGALTGREKGAIQSCAAAADLP